MRYFNGKVEILVSIKEFSPNKEHDSTTGEDRVCRRDLRFLFAFSGLIENLSQVTAKHK